MKHLVCSPAQHKEGEAAQTSNPITQKAETGGSEVEGYPRLQRRASKHGRQSAVTVRAWSVLHHTNLGFNPISTT